VYETSVAGGNVTSQDGAFTAPDDSEYDGGAGEAVQKKLYLAPAQTTLAADIDDSQTEIEVDHPVFDDELYTKIIIGSEKMTITAGWGTTTLTVTRGDTPAAASADDPVYYAYTYHNITIAASDESGTDDTDMFRYAPDVAGSPGSYVTSLSPSVMTDPTSDSYTFWRRITVDAATAAQDKVDMRHDVSFEAFEYAA